MKHVVCRTKLRLEDGTKYAAGDYATISDELYDAHGEAWFQLIEEVPEDGPSVVEEG